MIFFTRWMLVLRPLAAPIMQQYMKTISKVSVCVANLKRIRHACNYDLKASFFSICFYLGIFLPALYPLKTNKDPLR